MSEKNGRIWFAALAGARYISSACRVLFVWLLSVEFRGDLSEGF